MVALRSTQQPLLALTLGLGRLFLGLAEAGAGQCCAGQQQQQGNLELRGGRLDVGPHLPLFAGRWRFTKSIGEGVSAQVVEVEDVYNIVIANSPIDENNELMGKSRIIIDNSAPDERGEQFRSARCTGVEAPSSSEQRGLEAREAVGGGHKKIKVLQRDDARERARQMPSVLHNARAPRTYVLKIMKKHLLECGAAEASILRHICSSDPQDIAHIVRLHSAFVLPDGAGSDTVGGQGGRVHEGFACLVLERLADASLYDYLKHLRMNSLAIADDVLVHDARKVAVQLCVALTHLSNLRIVHGDLKPENILFTSGKAHAAAGMGSGFGRKNGAGMNRPGALFGGSGGGMSGLGLKLVDFGCSMYESEASSLAPENMEIQTLVYRAPEIIMRKHVGLESDAWALGCVLAEILLKGPLFSGSSPNEVMLQIMRELGVDDSGRPSESLRSGEASVEGLPPLLERLMAVDMCMADLVWGLLQWESAERLTPREALLHPALQCLLPMRAIAGALASTSTARAGGSAGPRGGSDWLRDCGLGELRFVRAGLAQQRARLSSGQRHTTGAFGSFEHPKSHPSAKRRRIIEKNRDIHELKKRLKPSVADPADRVSPVSEAERDARAVDDSCGKKWEAVRSVLTDFGTKGVASARDDHVKARNDGAGPSAMQARPSLPSFAVGGGDADGGASAMAAGNMLGPGMKIDDDDSAQIAGGGRAADVSMTTTVPRYTDIHAIAVNGGATRGDSDNANRATASLTCSPEIPVRQGDEFRVAKSIGRRASPKGGSNPPTKKKHAKSDSKGGLAASTQRSSRSRGSATKPWWIVQ